MLNVGSTQSFDPKELAVWFLFDVQELHFGKDLHFCTWRIFFFFQRLCFELLAVEVRGETLQENITHAGRCKPPEHSEQINASPSRQERLVTYIYLSAAHRLSLKTLRMCDEGLSKLLSASNFKSLESFDTPVRNSRQLSESTLSLLSALLCTTVVTLLYNICRDTKIYFLYGSTLVDEDSMKMKMKTSWTLGS